MGTSESDRHQHSTHSEQSLRRSLSSIHYSFPSVTGSLPYQPSPLSNQYTEYRHVSRHAIGARHGGLSRRDTRGNNGILRRGGNRRDPSPRSSAATSRLFSERVAAPPFSRDGSLSRERSAWKFQRRHSSVTVDTAQEMATRLTNEEREERRRLTNARLMEEGNISSRRLSSVTLVPPVPPTSPSVPSLENSTKKNKGYRSDYSLGETLRSSAHMIIEPNSEQDVRAVDLLKMHDFAFVKRSDGSYSFAILAFRSMEPMKKRAAENSSGAMEECMNFVIGECGSTKMVHRRNWSKSIRLVSLEGVHCDPVDNSNTMEHSENKTCVTPTSMGQHQHINEQTCDAVYEETAPKNIVDLGPPTMITYVPHMDDECSLISSVSDRVRGL